MIGYKFGGPLGAAIGGIAGAVAGIVRLFVKGDADKAKEKIKALYGVDIADKGVLQQIVDMAKSATKSSANRRELTSLPLSPGTLTS